MAYHRDTEDEQLGTWKAKAKKAKWLITGEVWGKNRPVPYERCTQWVEEACCDV